MPSYLEDRFGKVVAETVLEAPQVSLWPIEDLSEDLKDLVADIYLDYPLDGRTDVGGGTAVITVETVYHQGQEALAKLMKPRWKRKTKENVELVWRQVLRVVEEQSSLYQ